MKHPDAAEADAPTPMMETRAEDRVSQREVVAYAGGYAVGNLTEHVLTFLANPVFAVILGVSPAAVGMILALGRLWDAFSDTFIASVSDNFRSKWGRRRPFILVGGLLMGLTFAAVYWFPEGWSPQAYFWYLVVSAFVFYSAHTVFIVPHLSLLPELSASPLERTRLSAWASWFQFAAANITLWIMPLAQSSLFHSTLGGLRVVTGAVGVFSAVSAVGIFLTIRERHQERVQRQAKVPFVASVRATLKVKPLYFLAGSALLVGLSTNLSNSMGFYLLTYYVQSGDLKTAMMYQAWLGTAWAGSTLVGVPLAVTLSKRIGRRNTFLISIGLIGVASVLRWFCYTPGYPLLVIVPSFFIGPGIAVVQMLTASMLADVVDWDELRTGTRREGMIGAVQMWSLKATNSFSYAISGFILLLIGFDTARGVNQREGTFLWMRLVFGILPLILLAVGAWLIGRYAIGENVARANRAELERRRGA